MDKKLKAKWVAALRSGKYTQGRGQMFDPARQTHCCLGVLCRVKRISLVTRDESGRYERVSDLLGDDVVTELWKRNDGVDGRTDHSFEQIATFIEQKL